MEEGSVPSDPWPQGPIDPASLFLRPADAGSLLQAHLLGKSSSAGFRHRAELGRSPSQPTGVAFRVDPAWPPGSVHSPDSPQALSTRSSLCRDCSSCRETWLDASQTCQQLKGDICQQQEVSAKHRNPFRSPSYRPVPYRRHLAGIHPGWIPDMENSSSGRQSSLYKAGPFLPSGSQPRCHLHQEAFLDCSAKVRSPVSLPSCCITEFSVGPTYTNTAYVYTCLVSLSPI